MNRVLAIALIVVGLVGGNPGAISAVPLRCDSTLNRIKSAVAKTKYPKTLLAIAKVESSLDPNAVGDQGRSKGLYQIREDLHGRVPKDIEGQTRKAAALFETLVEAHGYREAIRKWNGGGRASREYRKKVLLAMK